MQVNVKLLKKVRKLIAEEPRRLMMGDWGFRVDPNNSPAYPPCGTVACLAGWTVLAATHKRKWDTLFDGESLRLKFGNIDITERAANLMGVPLKDCPFYNTGWGMTSVLSWIDRQIDAASK